MQLLAKGKRWERRALRLLQQAGLQLVASNFRGRGGEIDLIMRDAGCLVFVEVRYRSHRFFGGGAASVDPVKQRRIANTAHQFLRANRQFQALPCRFDVIAIDGATGKPTMRWIRAAFESPGH